MRSSFWLPAVAGFGDDLSDETYYPGAGTPEMPSTDPEQPPSDLSMSASPQPAPVSVISPGAVSPRPPATVTSTTPATASTGTASPWSTIGSAFSDIFGNLSKNVLPSVVNKELGVTLPGQTPGIVPTPAGRLTTGSSAGEATAAKAGGAGLIIAAVAIGVILLLKKR